MKYKVKINFKGFAIVTVEAINKKNAALFAYERFYEHAVFNEEYTGVSVKEVKQL